ncbi:MAG: 4-hydroxy-3-methylbut-2-enyl diphosphate reductase [Clostridia bacterium]|nr:4-hydroxy-3-methylbut-2-enyl diphosphate reductase [Clostridia bacterium]
MEIIKAKHSGFCFGVKRAIDETMKLSGENNFILGDIIHNEKVIENLKEKGIKTIYSLFEHDFSDNDTLVIRTHGEPKSTYDFATGKGVKIIDCTCPFVQDIQKKVLDHYKNGYTIVIIGNEKHPEVIGINGWCDNNAVITDDVDKINEITSEKICIVVQTTYSEVKFNEIIKKIKYNTPKMLDIFNTICYTTTKRQKEAFMLSAICDATIVIGGKNSNNTQELFEICKKNCRDTYRIIDPSDFDYKILKNKRKVGVVLGASTPIEQFQEVVQNMEKITEEVITNEIDVDAKQDTPVEQKEVKSEMEKAFNSIKTNKNFRVKQVVTAKISSVKDEGLTISLKDIKSDFELPKEELISDFVKENFKVGDEIRVMVVGKNPMRFSEKAMAKILAEEAEIEEIKNGKIFEAVIESTNKGGLIGKFGSYQVFVPSSQIRIGFVKDLEKYVGKKLRLKAEKVESKGIRKQIVGSQRTILEAEKAIRDAERAEKEAEFFDNIQEGDVVLGTPLRFTNFGAFVSVNGFDCLAHISDLSWTGCKNCADVLEIGKEYEFKILKIDTENKRVSIGYKQLQPRPWDLVSEKYAVGDVIKGKVVRIVPFGAFVEIEKGIDGLVHVSQISNKWLENPVTALTEGQEVEAKILDINPEKEKITLSIKALLPEEPQENAEDGEDKKAKGKKRAKKTEENAEEELREWKDDASGDVSIAEMINKD